MNYDYMGAIKIKDGVFLGDQFASQDLEFIVTNKVSRIVNCASRQIPNHWESIGIIYLSFPWVDNDQQIIFQSDESINVAIKFIDDALINGESVIVLSARGHNRSVAVLCVYLMKKYRWTLYKTLQFMHNRRPDLEIKAHFFNQLLSIEARFSKQGYGAKTFNWDEIYTQGDNDEIVLRNTYLNSQALGVAEFKDHDSKPKEYKLTFADKITMQIPPYDKIIFSKSKTTSKVIKPIIKESGSSKQIDSTFQFPQKQQQQKLNYEQNTNIYDKLSQKQKQTDQQIQSPLQISPIQPQRPSSVQQKQHHKVQSNNYMDSKEQFFQKSQQQNQLAVTGTRRPQTAPNQLKAPRVQTTPYKGNNSQGQKYEIGLQPNSQFKPMRKRAQSPKAVYNITNPYIQREFKAKTWKK
ncbi:unnamed protein product (macronuclear) [Paramecium tetraurelia]|uniref:Tyrosine-protein phosphatase domain-containing protein n=1 Tax=Paramecium tetraurelia TaxID=5888 RepID=A0EHK0_PARTE|nr:uncharacterized protein GSPATT00027115001 [Paramecium tetraurelia]CAK94791.1 unnamed protein product [Paramecium tetraurelia]|eukprot:XP_001462164.1 hypothetical protein (macronuclear) [Paramecium tetraurelia strain d4-2]